MMFLQQYSRPIYFFLSKAYGIFLRVTGNVLNLAPLRITLHPTSRCNFKCSYCHVATGLNQDVDTLEFDEWKKMVEKIRPLSVVSFTGGEPLLFKNIDVLIRKAKKRLCIATLVTNGSLLTDSKIDDLYNSGLDYLMISIDGFEDVHDRSRGVQGSFAKIKKALDYIEAKYEKRFSVGLKVVLSEESIYGVEKLIEFSKHYQCVTDIAFNLIYDNIPNGALYTFESLDDESFYVGNTFEYSEDAKKSLLAFIQNHKERRHKNLSFTLKLKQHSDLVKYITTPRSYGVKKCTLPWTDISILPNGDITSCLNFKLENIRNLDYKVSSVVKSKRTKYFQKFMKQNQFLPACEGCPLAHCHQAKR